MLSGLERGWFFIEIRAIGDQGRGVNRFWVDEEILRFQSSDNYFQKLLIPCGHSTTADIPALMSHSEPLDAEL